MRSAKGSTLIEVLTVILIVAILSYPLAKLSTLVIRDIPATQKIIEANTSMLSFLKYLRNDIAEAVELPRSVEGFVADSNTILIEKTDSFICYSIEEYLIVRNSFDLDLQNGSSAEWKVPYGNVLYRPKERDGRVYALEVEVFFQHRIEDVIQKKFRNSHLFFVGAKERFN